MPLDQTSPDQTDLIDLETNAEKDKTDLQEALRKNRPGSYLKMTINMYFLIDKVEKLYLYIEHIQF